MTKGHEEYEIRVINEAWYFFENESTLRELAGIFNLSKSTIHRDLTKTLPEINGQLAREVDKILQKNKKERHIRGGEATRRKYDSLKK